MYTSLDRETCIAEIMHRLSLDIVKPRSERRLYAIKVDLKRVVDLSHWRRLVSLGFNRAELESDDFNTCQRIGDAVRWLGNDGLLVPSIRVKGTNLVLYPRNFEGVRAPSIVRMEDLPPFDRDDPE